MKKITVRQLLRDFKTLFPLPNEGLEVERKDGSFFIYPVRQMSDNSKPKEPIEIKSDTPSNLEEAVKPEIIDHKQMLLKDLTPTTKEVVREQVWEDRDFAEVFAQVSVNYCQHRFEKGIKQKTYLISLENNEGTMTFENKWVCNSCVQELMDQVDRNGGRIIGS